MILRNQPAEMYDASKTSPIHCASHLHTQEYSLNRVHGRGSESDQAVDSPTLSVVAMGGRLHRSCNFAKAARALLHNQPAYFLILQPIHSAWADNSAMPGKRANILPMYLLHHDPWIRFRSTFQRACAIL